MKNKLITISGLLLFLVVFCFTYGVAYFPTLDADNAIQVIMIDHLSIPKDLYYLGQDRIGSIVPGLGWLFYQLGFSSLWSVTLTQLIIMLLSGLVLMRLFKSPLLACVAAMVMMFPLSEFESQVLSGHPYLGHLLILFLAIWAFKKYGLEKPVFLFFLGIGFWASGIFVANIAAAGLIFLFSTQLRSMGRGLFVWGVKGVLIALPGIALLWWAKNTATTTDSNYTQSSFVSFDELGQNLGRFFADMWHFLSFEHPDPWMSVSLWLMLILTILSLRILVKGRLTSWSSFFILSGLITFVAIISSEWAFRMGLPRRYFSIGFIQLMWGLMLAWDARPQSTYKHVVSGLLLLNSLLIAGSGLLAHDKFWRRVPDRLYAETAHKLASAIETEGILGSYWYVYLVEAFDPENITSLVEQNGINRDFDAMKRFSQLDTVTIIGKSYLAELKNTIRDHGIIYKKAGPTREIDGVQFAEYYKPDKSPKSYSFSELRRNYGNALVDTAGDSLWHISPETFTGNNFAVFGPYVTLDAGTYKVCFDLEVKGDIGPEAFVDVHYRSTDVSRLALVDNKYKPCIEFSLEEPAIYMEFRVGYYGRGEIYFTKVDIEKLAP